MIELHPIGYVRSTRQALEDDGWESVTASVELLPEFDRSALAGLADFSHADIIYLFDQVPLDRIERGARHPRGNQAWPLVGIFAQRAKDRPNRLGLTTVSILSVEGSILKVGGLDAVDGTPVLDIKPVMAEFLPRGELRQPDWSRQLMSRYW